MFTKSRRGDPRHSRRGFTLVELLVVITIIGMLMAMMFPALGSVLEVVRLNGCANNLSSVGKAIAVGQATAGGAWPVVSTEPVTGAPAQAATEATLKQAREARTPTTRNRPGRPQQEKVLATGYSWITGLLANIDERNMATKINTKSNRYSLSAFDPSLVDDDGKHFSQTPLRVMQCPVAGTTGSNAPEYVDFTKKLGENARDFPVAVTNFVAISATHLSPVMGTSKSGEGPNGVIFYSKTQKGPTKIQDGDTNTLVLTETREADYASWFDGTTSWVVAHDPNTEEPSYEGTKLTCRNRCQHALNVGPAASADPNKPTYYREIWTGKKPWAYGPSSQHANGLVNHMYGDKRVATIRAEGPQVIPANVYMALVTRSGGESDRPPE